MKEKKPGDHIILRLKKTESPSVVQWINKQSNLSDAIRYLIEGDIQQHDIRDLQEHIPAKRSAVEHKPSDSYDSAEKSAAAVSDSEISAVGAGNNQNQQRNQWVQQASKQESARRLEPVQSQTAKQENPQPSQRENSQPAKEDNYSDELIDHWMNI